MMMVRRCLYMVLMLLCSTLLQAQEDLKEKMNAIKQNPDYYWGEATGDTREAASAEAMTELVGAIAACNVTTTEQLIKGKTQFIHIPRGERIRAFAYIQKTDVTQSSGTVVETQQNVQQQVQQQAQQQTQQQTTETEVQAQEPQMQQQTTVTVTGSGSVSASVLMALAECEQVTDVARCLRDFKREGMIGDYGKVSSRAQLAEANYLVIYDDTLRVRAILAPPSGTVRKNISTGDADDTHNYKGCGVMWFR